jgi:hypothetical protein
VFLFKTQALVKSKFSHLEVVMFPAVENSPSFAVFMEETDRYLRTTLAKEWCFFNWFSHQHIITSFEIA